MPDCVSNLGLSRTGLGYSLTGDRRAPGARPFAVVASERVPAALCGGRSTTSVQRLARGAEPVLIACRQAQDCDGGRERL